MALKVKIVGFADCSKNLFKFKQRQSYLKPEQILLMKYGVPHKCGAPLMRRKNLKYIEVQRTFGIYLNSIEDSDFNKNQKSIADATIYSSRSNSKVSKFDYTKT
jgi:hypothetical protein